jgi:threonine aldolase
VDVQDVQTNIVIAEVTAANRTAHQVVQMFKEHNILILPVSPVRIRLVTHLDVGYEDIDRSIGTIKRIFG